MRPTSFALVIAQGVADAIRNHAQANPDMWWKVPDTVARGARISYASARRPVVVVTVESGAPDNQGMSDGGITELENLTIVVYGLVDDQNDPEAAALELLSDVRRSLALNRQLAPPGGQPLIPGGFIHDLGFTVTPQPADAGPLGEFSLRLQAKYSWTPLTV